LESLFENIKDKIKVHNNKYIILHIDLNGVFTKEKFIERIDSCIRICLKDNDLEMNKNINLDTFSTFLYEKDKKVKELII
jgi:hypothetical protein